MITHTYCLIWFLRMENLGGTEPGGSGSPPLGLMKLLSSCLLRRQAPGGLVEFEVSRKFTQVTVDGKPQFLL